MKKLIFLLWIAFTTTLSSAQEVKEARKTLDTLSSKTMWGRGYTKDGMKKAADYILARFNESGLMPMTGNDFKQPFSYPVNSFAGKMEATVNGQKLIPGKDFIVDPASVGQKNKNIKVSQTDSNTFMAIEQRLVLRLQDKLTWSVSQKMEDYTVLQLNKNAVEGNPENVSIDIENTFIPEFKTSNICGIIKGSRVPDSLLLITAHYDHLGGMGNNTYFPGANDNASGISLLLSLVKYYAANPPAYSIGFICFAGEEAGLLGSSYFTKHPLVSLNKIKFMVNVDMVGTGEKGITVVNATLHPKEFALINSINDQHKYLPKINARGKAANSDHFFFTELGVPAFFIYTQGGISAYHDIYDQPATLPFTAFNDLFHLFIDFNAALMN